MSGRAWIVPGLLVAALGLRVVAWTHEGSGFATLPILVPTSLEYEARSRQERQQPAGQGGAEAIELADQLLAAPDALDPSLAPEIEALALDRAQLLELRQQRHRLNVRLMQVGVSVATQLSPAQWDSVNGRRDALKAEAEAGTFDRLLARLRASPAPADPGAASPEPQSPEPQSPAQAP